MKISVRILGLAVLAAIVTVSLYPSECSAKEKQKYRQELTDNKQLEEANEAYKKAASLSVF